MGDRERFPSLPTHVQEERKRDSLNVLIAAASGHCGVAQASILEGTEIGPRPCLAQEERFPIIRKRIKLHGDVQRLLVDVLQATLFP